MLSACTNPPTATPVIPTDTQTPIPPTITISPTPEPTATPTLVVFTYQDISIPHPLENQEMCDACHGSEELIPFPENHIGRVNESCKYCHLVTDDVVNTPDINTFTQTACLTCHGPFEKLIDINISAEAEDGNTINPHIYIPHDSTDSSNVPECTDCHKPHKLPSQSEKELALLPKPSLETCYDCHHVRNFTNCHQCHVIIPVKE